MTNPTQEIRKIISKRKQFVQTPLRIGLLHYSNDRANFKSLQMEINNKSILRSSEIMNKRELCQRLSIGKA